MMARSMCWTWNSWRRTIGRPAPLPGNDNRWITKPPLKLSGDFHFTNISTTQDAPDLQFGLDAPDDLVGELRGRHPAAEIGGRFSVVDGLEHRLIDGTRS